jgi:hypothetical protein
MRKKSCPRESIISFIENTGRTLSTTGERMRPININNAKQFETFLRILAEESVSEARTKSKSHGVDPAQETYSGRRQRSDIDRLSIQEQEEDPEAEEESPDSPSVEPAVELEPESDPESEVDVGTSSSRAKIPDDINDMRQGHSVDNPEVKPELNAWLERLDDVEVKILDKFLEALSGILNKRMKADQAPDPSEVLGLDYVSKEESEEAPEEEVVVAPGDSGDVLPSWDETPEGKAALDALAGEEEEEEEDITPPVRVGSPQQISEIRKKVRRLMKM